MNFKNLTIGVLALQGDFEAHHNALKHGFGVTTRKVRLSSDLDGLDGLILPGGESTTIGKLMVACGLDTAIREKAMRGFPIFGTCAGLILLALEVQGSTQPTLGILDITIERNAFGRQVDSFETDIEVPAIAETPIRGVFIRAPLVSRVGQGVTTLASFRQCVVAVQQANLLGAAFHPELTGDTRFHGYFLEIAQREKSKVSQILPFGG